MGRIRRKEEEARNKINREAHRGKVPDEWFELPASKTSAQEANNSKFFDGKSCKKGHISLRFTGGACIECHAEKDKQNQVDPEYMSARSAWRKSYRKREDVREKRK